MNKILKTIILFLLFSLTANQSYAHKISITDNWKYKEADDISFAKKDFDDSQWQTVNIPHTWNAKDIIDEPRGYRRAASWYRKMIVLPEDYRDKKIVLLFEGIGSKADVYLNGELLKTHLGAYTAFTVDITDKYMTGEENIIAVRADNSSSLGEILPPVSGDFSMHGGIYRRVYLQTFSKVYFDFEPYASSGILICTPEVSAQSAEVKIKGTLKNETGKNQKVTVIHSVFDKQNNLIARVNKDYSVKSGQGISFSDEIKGIKNPVLWSHESPYLYTVWSEITDKSTGETLQKVISPLGFRWFSVDNSGFYLNGKKVKLRGAARHQDYVGLGVAIPSEMNYNDMKALKEMGANFVRISHYPQDSEIYRACDELGLIAWSEICIVNEVKKNEQFAHNSKEMLMEMIYQNYNHPSVVMWGAMNELWDYHDDAVKLAKELEAIKKELDPGRLSCVAFHAFTWEKPYKQDSKEMFGISDINGVNVYEAWYHGNFSQVPDVFSNLRSFSPDRPMFVSEFGAGSDERIHSYDPKIFDFTPEYQIAFNREYINEIEKRNWFIGYSIWNLIDFQVDGRIDTQPNINNKGMLTADRKKKEIYYYYQTRWSTTPMIHIGGADWTERAEVCGKTVNNRPLIVYSNQKEVELYHNGKSLGKKQTLNGEAAYNIPFVDGKNVLEAISGELKDFLEINMKFIPEKLADNKSLSEGFCINLGQDHTYFRDPLTGNIWIPDQQYAKGSWGYKDGEMFASWPNIESHNGVRMGIAAAIKNTDLEPLFQTFMLGITGYKLDVPEGKYELSLCFTEPFNRNERKDADRTGTSADGERIFDVSINGEKIIHALNLSEEYGDQAAVIKTFVLPVSKKDDGINIKFTPIKGKTVLSGIKVTRLN